ncbi:hypothetical protein MPER_01884 [Moniliophthora perniciosa FA553]|nr:hypothetical protein MPER_01884 [Moniliophthora perniciosa FA553]
MSQKPNWRRGRKGGRTHKERITYPQRKKDLGILVTDELESALASCKERVDRIARECRARNRKFSPGYAWHWKQTTYAPSRDIEFDLENDRDRCLHGLGSDEHYEPADVQRITEIFKNPQFFIDGADSNDLVQGQIGDCWFISALATMATAGGLVEKFCVAVRRSLPSQRTAPHFYVRETKKSAYTALSFSEITPGAFYAYRGLLVVLIDLVQHGVYCNSEV